MPVQSRAGASGPASVAAGLARIIRLIAWVVVAIIVAGILLVVLKANRSNDVVSAIHDVARTLVGPFSGMFTLHNARLGVAVNWGIAALVYLILGYLVARLVTMLGTVGTRRRRTATP